MMPFHRGCYLTHPTTGEAGLWLELSVDPPGTLTGMPWPDMTGHAPLSAYNNYVNAQFTALFHRAQHGQVVMPKIKFSSLTPLTLDPEGGVSIEEGDCKSFSVGGAG